MTHPGAKISLRAPFEISMGKWVQPLTDSEGYLVWALMNTRWMTLEDLAAVVWGPPHRWPLDMRGGINQRVFLLRNKLKPFGWTIECSGTGRWQRHRYKLLSWTGEEVLAA